MIPYLGGRRMKLHYIAILFILSLLTMQSLSPVPISIGSTGAPTDVHLDVGISKVTLTGTLGDRFFPGDTIRIVVEIGHDNDPIQSERPIVPGDNLTVVVITDDGIDNVTTMYAKVPNLSTNYSIARNGTYRPFLVNFTWVTNRTLQDIYYSVDVYLIILDDDTSDNLVHLDPVLVAPLRSQPFIWEEGQQDRKYESPTPHKVNVGETLFVPFQLQNRGSEVDRFEIEVLSVPEGWEADIPGEYTIQPQDYIDLMLAVQVSNQPIQALADEDHRVIVNVRSVYEGNRTYDEQTVHIFRFSVNAKAGATLDPEESSVYITPGSAGQVIFWLKNTGNFPDDYTLDVQIDEVHLRKGWRATFESGTKQPTVRPGELFKVILRVTAPVDAARYYNLNIHIDLRSMNMNYSTRSDPCTVFADILYAGDIEEKYQPLIVEPGTVNKIPFNYTNEGNDRDPNMRLVVTYKPKGWWVMIDQAPITLNDGIGPWTTVPLSMDVFVEETTTASDKGSLPFIVIQARGSPYDILLDEERFYFHIPLRHKLLLEIEDNDLIGEPGDIISVNATITNRGNWLDTFRIYSDNVSIGTNIDTTVQEIAPNQTLPIIIKVTIPEGINADSDPSTPYPDEDGLFDPYLIEIRGNSTNETVLENTTVSVPLKMFILPVYDLELELISGPVLKLPFDHVQDRTLTVKVRNTGNIGVDISPSIKDEPDWLTTNPDLRYLSFNGIQEIRLFLDYHAFDMDNGDIREVVIDIGFGLDPSPMMHEELSMEFMFLSYTFHIVTAETVPVKVPVEGVYELHHGTNLSFRVTVEREGEEMLLPITMNGPYLALYLDGDERKRTAIPMMDAGNQTVIALGPLQVLFLGEHTIEIKIEGMGAESTEGDTSVQFDVMVETPESTKDDSSLSDTALAAIIIAVILILALVAASIFVLVKGVSFRDEEAEE
ncbi:MAG: hypothetical protein ACMUHU_02960 [Thermoplasmatota archaeon]